MAESEPAVCHLPSPQLFEMTGVSGFQTTQADTLCQSVARSDQKERRSDLLSLSLRAVLSPPVTDLSRCLELVKATGGGRETGESEQRVRPTERRRVCVCGTARADKKGHFLVT